MANEKTGQGRASGKKQPNRFEQARKRAAIEEVRSGAKSESLRENKPVMQGLILSAVAIVAVAVVVAIVVSVVGVEI